MHFSICPYIFLLRSTTSWSLSLIFLSVLSTPHPTVFQSVLVWYVHGGVIEKASMPVDCFVGCIRRSGRICYLWYLVLTTSIFYPSHYSHRILNAERSRLKQFTSSSQTSKIRNLPHGGMGVPSRHTVNALFCMVQLFNITPICCWNV